MASHTSRIVDLETQMASVQLQLESQHQDLKAAIAELAASTKDSIEALTASFGRNREKSPIRSPPHSQAPFADQQHFRHPQRRPSILDHYPRLEFSYFSGTDPHVWVSKCTKLFHLYAIPEEQKVDLVSYYLEGRAYTWFEGWSFRRFPLVWGHFVDELLHRFGNREQLNVVAAFNKLRQTSSVGRYQEEFEDLRSRLLRLNPELNEHYFILSFLGGLDEEIQPRVQLLNPPTLACAFYQARLEESAIDARKKKTRAAPPGRWTASPSSSSGSPFQREASLPSPSSVDRSPVPRGQGLCYKCGDKYFHGHTCARKKQLQMMQAEAPSLTSEEGEIDEDFQDAELEVSLQSMGSGFAGNSLLIPATSGRREVTVLIDTGSSHTFLNSSKVVELSCKPEHIAPMRVKVASGHTLLSDSVCKGFCWKMQGQDFAFDVRTLDLPAHDLVLGWDWLETISPFQVDLKKRQLSFDWHGRNLTLQGLTNEGHCKLISGRNLQQLIRKPDSHILGAVFSIEAHTPPAPTPTFLQPLLSQYSDIFDTPTSLPPSRPFDHSIPLLPNTKPINIRPYRFPHHQKEVAEKLVAEMLKSEFIQGSHSPYASPVLLIGKKDGTWRFCVDYRELNAATIKDKFPIPHIEDLLDELQGAVLFSKLDLRAGYHQVRMHPADQFKTAFRTHQGHYEFRVMPFGLTNAPATFQALMNHVFGPYLRKFILVFFDDILIYSKSESEHLVHLEIALQLLRKHHLFAKASKCSFGQPTVEYLGHVISKEGVSTDSNKVAAMQSWPRPTSVKGLRGFLGLTGYYRKFIKHYGTISRPLTELLKKNGFLWSSTAEEAFLTLKAAMSQAPVLGLPNFTQSFTLETDASGSGVGAVLSQGGRPLAFFSKALSLRNQGLSTYEKEYLAVLLAVDHWRHYLEGRQFTIVTDHESLKFLLGQKVHTAIQKKGLVKLLGLDFQIKYRKGRYNGAADALSRVFDDQLEGSSCNALTSVLPEWLVEIEQSYAQDAEVTDWIAAAAVNTTGPSLWSYSEGILRYRGAIVVGSTGYLRTKLLQLFHSSPVGGHSGAQGTYQRLKSCFYWRGMKTAVTQWVSQCAVCQRCKAETVASPGFLQPLPIPTRAWKDISMDFVEGLPMSKGKQVLLVVVDRFTKSAHFFALSHPYTAAEVALTFFDGVFRLHGMPSTIVCDRDSTFTSMFWTEFFRLQHTDIHYSTAYHPQTDGQTERVNRCLEDYLRCMTFHRPQDWVDWLTLAEWCYNTHFHISLQMSPFEALYGFPPSFFGLGAVLPTPVGAVEDRVSKQHLMTQLLTYNITKAQNRQKQYADRRRSERVLQVGDWAYLRLQPYRQGSVVGRQGNKLDARYFGPYKVLAKIGAVAYKLSLPAASKIHPVFHVSQLKLCRTVVPPAATQLPDADQNGSLKLAPTQILARRFIQQDNQAVTQVLVHWTHQLPEDATWEDLGSFRQSFPAFPA
ncbi:unnamed protein product [Linum trigynum]|uniref:Reverse transcriptase n=1 Tax=Linum trigynum TaxID=586398 RepID=A0AAV2CNQ6_9ROSI